MRYPDFLVQGGTVGFVAPSFGCATEPYITGFKKAQDRLKNMGLNIANLSLIHISEPTRP